MEIRKIARSLDRLREKVCNVEMSDTESQRADRRDDRLVARAAEIAVKHGYLVYNQGDCRGCPLYLYRAEDLAKQPGYDIDAIYSSIGFAVCP